MQQRRSRRGRVRTTTVERVAGLLDRSGALDAWRRSARQVDRWLKRLELAGFAQRGSLVFMFHRLTHGDDPIRLGFDVGLFELICAHLATHYEVLPLLELERRRRGRRPPSNAVALTFDDGYADNLELGLPILRRYGLPATVFVTTGAIDRRVPLWTSRLACLVEQGRAEGEPPTACGVPLQLDDDAGRETTYLRLCEQLKRCDDVEREETIARLKEQLGGVDFACLDGDMLSWEQIRQCDAAGLTAGAHTITHPILSRLDERQIEAEVVGCKEELEGQLGRRVLTFAYPNGESDDYDRRCTALLRRAGYQAAYTTIFGANTPQTDPFELRRVTSYGKTSAHMALQTERFFYTT